MTISHSKPLLFIGGPADGRRMTFTNERVRYISVPEPRKAVYDPNFERPMPVLTEHRYRILHWWEDMYVALSDDIKDVNFFKLFYDGYRDGRKDV